MAAARPPLRPGPRAPGPASATRPLLRQGRGRPAAPLPGQPLAWQGPTGPAPLPGQQMAAAAFPHGQTGRPEGPRKPGGLKWFFPLPRAALRSQPALTGGLSALPPHKVLTIFAQSLMEASGSFRRPHGWPAAREGAAAMAPVRRPCAQVGGAARPRGLMPAREALGAAAPPTPRAHELFSAGTAQAQPRMYPPAREPPHGAAPAPSRQQRPLPPRPSAGEASLAIGQSQSDGHGRCRSRESWRVYEPTAGGSAASCCGVAARRG